MIIRKLHRAIIYAADSIFVGRFFTLWERLGFHITPNHFYQPVPDTRALDDSIWTRRSKLAGIDINASKQIELLEVFTGYRAEYESFSTRTGKEPWQFKMDNPGFGPIDAEVLYCIIRRFQPRKILEIGCGHSTYLSAEAVLKNCDLNGVVAELTAVDPLPGRTVKFGFPGLSRLIAMTIDRVDPAEYESLEENDILFIDSSHVLKIGSDVQYEYLEILPRLKKGVLVHIHDIFFPCEYPEIWVRGMRRFWNEQYLVQAFLSFNSVFEIVWCGSYMHLNHPDKLQQAFPSYDPDTVWNTIRPGATSLWIRKIK